jgi:hypothetical protein
MANMIGNASQTDLQTKVFFDEFLEFLEWPRTDQLEILTN